jgi:hypothetical protein
MFDAWNFSGAWRLELGALPARPSHSSFCIFHFAFAHAITGGQQLNFSRECRMQIYAIYFHFSRVGMPSDPKI